ncbi:serine/threonine protein kinase [Bifidobacterium choerinum]|uniref:Serine/threonine protein kinase n=1 Tax=Bifidobacterium choerinum TaxID=35760 RepID=A0A087AGP4_9BIFI|nr:serine/threonine protein kinase [Bifidobacterium choerinum]
MARDGRRRHQLRDEDTEGFAQRRSRRRGGTPRADDGTRTAAPRGDGAQTHQGSGRVQHRRHGTRRFARVHRHRTHRRRQSASGRRAERPLHRQRPRTARREAHRRHARRARGRHRAPRHQTDERHGLGHRADPRRLRHRDGRRRKPCDEHRPRHGHAGIHRPRDHRRAGGERGDRLVVDGLGARLRGDRRAGLRHAADARRAAARGGRQRESAGSATAHVAGVPFGALAASRGAMHARRTARRDIGGRVGGGIASPF